MSDAFSKCCSSFKKEIAITQADISYSAKTNARKILFALEIPLPLLKEWHRRINEEASNRKVTSGQNFATGNEDEQASLTPSTSQNRQYRKNLDYIDLLEYSVPCGLFAFTDDQAVRDEISVHLMKLSNAVVQLYRKTKGRARKELDEKVKRVHVYEGQTKSVSEFYDEIECMTDDNPRLFRLELLTPSAIASISFPEAAILLVSDRDRDLWDNPFADNRILVVVPTAQARTNKSNKKQETKIFMRRFSFLSAN